MVNSHYIPQLILRHFCEDSKIQYYDIENLHDKGFSHPMCPFLLLQFLLYLLPVLKNHRTSVIKNVSLI